MADPLAQSYQHGDASVRAAASDADINSYHLGVYAGADLGAARIEPFAQIARIWVDSELLGERGGAAALEVARAKMSTSVSTLGARLD